MNANWTRFNKYVYKYWKLQTAVIIFGLISLPLTLLIPYLTKLIIDKAYSNRDLKLFIILAIIGGSIFVLNSFIKSLGVYLSQRINRHVRFDIAKDFHKHLQSLPISFFKERSTGEYIYEMSNDVASASDFVCDAVPKIITLFPRLLFILAIVFYLNWKLALLATLMVPISYIHPYLFRKWLKETTRRVIEKSQNVFEMLHEIFTHIHLIKAFGKEDYEINRFEKNLTKEIDLEVKNIRLSNISAFSGSILNKAIGGIIALYGGYQVIKGTMTLGSLTAIMIYMAQLLEVIRSIGIFYESVAVNSVSCQRLAGILDIKPEIEDSKDAVYHNISQGGIVFRDVSFWYKKDGFSMKNINFSIEPNSKVALVGPSGCGKTTLISLILRLYDVKKGSIFIDGLNIKDIKLNSLKRQIGVALQEPFLWNDTIANNILYSDGDVGEEEMIKAAEAAEAHNFIMSLPNQYNSIIGEMACKISEGQKQRIAIARVLVRRPKIIILDEAMSSIDLTTEEKIINNILSEFEDSTVIIVSHRPSSIKKMNRIYSLQNGFVTAESSYVCIS